VNESFDSGAEFVAPKKRTKFRYGRLLFLLLIVVGGMFLFRTYTGAVVISDSGIAAVVSGEKITVDELNTRYEEVPDYYKSLLSKTELLNQMVEDRLVMNDVSLKGYSASESDVKASIEKFKDEIGMTDEEFNDSLQLQGITYEDFYASMEKRAKVEKFFENELFSGVKITADEIELYYVVNEKSFAVPARAKVRHILILVNESEADSMTRIKAIRAEAQGDFDFAELAKKYSEGPTATTGGDLGYITKDAVVPEFADVVFALDVGEVSQPFKTDFGYHIAYLEEMQEAGILPLDEVSEQIKNILTQEQEQSIFDTYILQLKSAAEIEILYQGE